VLGPGEASGGERLHLEEVGLLDLVHALVVALQGLRVLVAW
jgi:hypothetical protein